MTKIQSGKWENVRFVDRVRDLTATQGERSRFTKILGKKGIRERDDRSVGFGFDLTKKWESGIREVTRLSRSIFPRWSKEQVIFLVMRPFSKMFQTKVCSVLKSL